jgi:hypothetical protein
MRSCCIFRIMTALTVGTVASYFSDNVGSWPVVGEGAANWFSGIQKRQYIAFDQRVSFSECQTLRQLTALFYRVSSCLVSRLILNLRDPSLSSRFAPRSVEGTRDMLSTVRWEGSGMGDQRGGRSLHPPLEQVNKPEDRRYSDRSKVSCSFVSFKTKVFNERF